MNRIFVMALAFLLAVGGLIVVATTYSLRHRKPVIEARTVATAVDDQWRSVDWITDYKLVERSGESFDSRSLQGQVHVASFFFASCPGPCTQQNNQLQVLAKAYGSKGVKFLSITCDPKRDVPAVLRTYADRFQADPKQWLFLTGELALIRRIGAEKYGVPVDEMSHTEKFLVYDRWGKQRGAFYWKKSDELIQMRLLLDKLLAETTPPPEEKPVTPSPRPGDDDDDDGLPNEPGRSDTRSNPGETS